ncbi:MAG: hypothetical protein FRX49_13238 [Trebouxia sp. A1-2]|nr:MAG: hypothetical protein FRX49_13238 [Trebouxia sp. A1-2]
MAVCVLASRIRRFSVNVNDHTIKLKPENEYVRLDTSDFDSLLEELTDFVHNQHSEAEHYSEAEQQILEVAPALEVEHALAALCEQAVSPRARSRTVKVKIEIDLTDETPQLKKVKVEQETPTGNTDGSSSSKLAQRNR